MKKHTDSQLAKDCIFTALMILMEQKDFEDITISEIAQKAGVSRMTYYRTYSSKEDILIQHFYENAENLIQDIQAQKTVTLYDLFLRFFVFFKDHSNIVNNLAKANLLKLALYHFAEFSERLFYESKIQQTPYSNTRYPIYFYTGGLLALLLQWIENGQKESPESMAEMTCHMLNADITELKIKK